MVKLSNVAKLVQNAAADTANNVNNNAGAHQANEPENLFENEKEELGKTVAENLEKSGMSADKAKELSRAAVDYAGNTLASKDKDNPDGLVSFDEWNKGDTDLYMGLNTVDNPADRETMQNVFDAADLDGDGNLDGMELMNMYLMKDASTKDNMNVNNIELDGVINKEASKEGGKDIARGLQQFASDSGKEAAKAIANMAFGQASHIKQVGAEVREGLIIAQKEENGGAEVTEEQMAQINKTVKDMQTSIKSTMTKDSGFTDPSKETQYYDGIKGDDKLSFGEWAWQSSTQNFLGLDMDKAEDRQKIEDMFDALDTNSDGSLDVNELAAQYLYRDAGDGEINGNGAQAAEDLTRILDMSAQELADATGLSPDTNINTLRKTYVYSIGKGVGGLQDTELIVNDDPNKRAFKVD